MVAQEWEVAVGDLEEDRAPLHNLGRACLHSTHHLLGKTNKMDNTGSSLHPGIHQEILETLEVGALVEVVVAVEEPEVGLDLPQVDIKEHRSPNLGLPRNNHGRLGSTKLPQRKAQLLGNHWMIWTLL